MIDLYYWTTPNGHKITIFLEEAGLEYRIHPVNITRAEQFKEEYLKISPNNKIPAIVDNDPNDNKGPLSIFESGVILQYLAEKTGKFFPQDARERIEALKWLTWQVANQGPMAGQYHYFAHYAKEKVPQALERYKKITTHLYDVLEKQLKDKEFVTGKDYTIADMAIYPWAFSDTKDIIEPNDFPAIKTWMEKISQREAVKRAYAKADEVNKLKTIDEEGKKTLFRH